VEKTKLIGGDTTCPHAMSDCLLYSECIRMDCCRLLLYFTVSVCRPQYYNSYIQLQLVKFSVSLLTMAQQFRSSWAFTYCVLLVTVLLSVHIVRCFFEYNHIGGFSFTFCIIYFCVFALIHVFVIISDSLMGMLSKVNLSWVLFIMSVQIPCCWL